MHTNKRPGGPLGTALVPPEVGNGVWEGSHFGDRKALKDGIKSREKEIQLVHYIGLLCIVMLTWFECLKL